MSSTDPTLLRSFSYCTTDYDPVEYDTMADLQEVGDALTLEVAELANRLSLAILAMEDIEDRGLACAYVSDCRLINKRLDGSETDGGAFTDCIPS